MADESDLQTQIVELNDTIELLTLDKEQLLIDKELLEEKCLLLEDELAKFKAGPKSAVVASDGSGVEVLSAPQYLELKEKAGQLAEENRKLREALIKLNDLSTQEREKVKVLEEKCLNLELQNTSLEECKLNAEGEIEELKQNIDSLSQYESLIEKLTTDNLDLQSKYHEAVETIRELEENQELNEEIDQQQSNHIKSLQEEIENLKFKILQQDHLLQERGNQLFESTKRIEILKDSITTLTLENEKFSQALLSGSNEFKEMKSTQ
jgi:dynactin 1